MGNAYSYVIGKKDFWNSLLVSIERVVIGVPLAMLLTILVALSAVQGEDAAADEERVFLNLFFFTMLFSGGLIPRISADPEPASDGYDLGPDPACIGPGIQYCPDAELLPRDPAGAGGGVR